MTEIEILRYSYRNGGKNYVRKSNLENHWVDFSKAIINKLTKKHGDYFSLVIYWITDVDNVSYYQIPYKEIRHLLTEEHLTVEANGKRRRHKIPLSKLTNVCQTKESDIAFVCSNCHRMIHRVSPEMSIEDFKEFI